MLVTIGMVGMLAAIVRPTINAARETARRANCSSNMRQITNAMLSYESAQNELPGWRNAVGNFTAATGTAVSWTVPILPQLGNKDAYDWFDKYDASAVVREDISKKLLPIFVCPTSSGDARRLSDSPVCYAVNAGTGCERSDGHPLDLDLNGQPYAQWLGDGVFNDHVGNDVNSELVYSNQNEYRAAKSSLAAVVDGGGASTTIMMAERCGPVVTGGAAAGYSSWTNAPVALADGLYNAVKENHVLTLPPALAGGAVPAKSSVYKLVNPSVPHATMAQTNGGQFDYWQYRYPSSRHRGDGATVSFCDGRTAFVTSKIDSWVYCQLMTSRTAHLSPRAAAWEKYDNDNNAGTPAVRYIVSEADVTLK